MARSLSIATPRDDGNDRPARKQPPRLPWVGIVALALCLIYCAIVLIHHGGDVMTFVDIGARYTGQGDSGSSGYDGQFTYFIATDPFGAAERMDNPPYRYQRILYPLVVLILSLGQPALVPWMMVGVNIAAISVSAETLGRLLQRDGVAPIFAFPFVLWIGQVFSLRRSLNEPLCFMLVLLAVWWLRGERLRRAAIAFALGALAKDLALLFMAGAALHEWRHRRPLQGARLALIGLVPYLVWQAAIWLWMGRSGLAWGSRAWEAIPFYGLWFITPDEARLFAIIILALPAVVLGAAALVALLRRRPGDVTAWFLLLNVLFLMFLTRWSYTDLTARFRLGSGLVLAGQLFCARHGLRWLTVALTLLWLLPTALAGLLPGGLLW